MLKGRGPADLESTVGRARGADAGRSAASSRTERGAERAGPRRARVGRRRSRSFRQIIENQGGDPRVDRRLRAAAVRARSRTSSRAPRDGYRRRRSTPSWSAARGRARRRPRSPRRRRSIPASASMVLAPAGTRGARRRRRSLEIHHRGGRGLDEARRCCARPSQIGDEPPAPAPLVLDRIQGGRLMTTSGRRDRAAAPPPRARTTAAT